MKGYIEDPMSAIAVFGTAILLIMMIQGLSSRTGDFLKSETVDVQAERVVNAGLAADTMAEGELTVQMEGYEFRFDGRDQQVWIKYGDTEGNASIGLLSGSFSSISGPSKYQNVSERIIIVKDKTVDEQKLTFYVDEVPSNSGSPPPDRETYEERLERRLTQGFY